MFPVEIHAHHYLNGDEEYLLAFVNDLTETKRLEELKLRNLEYEKKLAQSANEEKTLFLSNMSHELRTPLHAIKSFTDLAIKNAQSPRVKKYLSNIQSSTSRLKDLIDDLLAMSEKQNINKHRQSVDKLVLKVIDELTTAAESKDISINFSGDREFGAKFDYEMLSMAINKIISNAIKYSQPSNDIDVNLSNQNDDYFEISVTDTGVGIPSDQLEKVFEPFTESSNTKSAAGGVGLGLAIVRGFIELHDGKVWAESPPAGKSQGCRCIIQMPYS